jgi:hypothetical protein
MKGVTLQERSSNYAAARKVVEDRLYASIGVMVDKVHTVPECVQDWEAITGKMHQVIFLSEELRVLFSAYTYMLLEELVKAGELETAERIHERYGRMAVSHIKPIEKFWLVSTDVESEPPVNTQP